MILFLENPSIYIALKLQNVTKINITGERDSCEHTRDTTKLSQPNHKSTKINNK